MLPAQERLLAGDAHQLRLDPRLPIRETTKLCFHAFQVPLQRCGGRRNRLRVRLRSRLTRSRRKKTQQLWRRRVSRSGPRVSKKACLDTPRVRGAHVCCRVSAPASAPVPASASVSFLRGSFSKPKVCEPSEISRIGPAVCSSGRHHRPGRPQHRQTAPRRPLQEGGERGPGGRPSPAILTKVVTFFGWKRFEMNETLGNDAPVDYETISHHQL